MDISEKKRSDSGIKMPKKKSFISHFAKERNKRDYIDSETKNATVPFLFKFYKEIASSRGNVVNFMKSEAVSDHGAEAVNKLLHIRMAQGEPFSNKLFTDTVKLVQEMYKKGYLAVANYLLKNKISLTEDSIKEHLRQLLQRDPMLDVPNKGEIESDSFAESNQLDEVTGGMNVPEEPKKRGQLITVAGKMVDVYPANGSDFDYKELRKIIGADHVQILSLRNQGWLVIDDEGKLKDKPINMGASLLYANFNPNDYIVGDALFCAKSMIK